MRGTGVHPFDRDTAVEVIGAGAGGGGAGAGGLTTLRASLSRRWWVQRGPNGGYIAAIMQRAMQEVAGTRPPRSMTVQFASAPAEGEVEIEVRTVREGRSVTFLTGLMRQGDEVVLSAVAIFGEVREARLEYTDPEAAMPAEAGEPGEMFVPSAETPGVPPVFENFMARVALGEPPLSGGERARTGAWIRTAEPRVMDAALATAVLDVWLPAPFIMLERPSPAPT